MNIGVLSDTRFLPSRTDTPGHGLGRLMAMIAEGLAQRGHSVTFYAGKGSAAKGCAVVETDDDETTRARDLIRNKVRHDVWLDGTHLFDYAARTNAKVVCRSCDRESKPPRNAIYTTRAHAAWIKKDFGGVDVENAVVVYDGFDLSTIPFQPNARGRHFLAVSNANAAAWKRPHLADKVATETRRPLWIVGHGVTDIKRPHLGAMPPARLYQVMGHSAALVHLAVACSGAATITEANATGTPVLTLKDHDQYQESMLDGVTGFAVNASDPQKIVEKVALLEYVEPKHCREWVGDKRSYRAMIDGYENALTRALEGETW